MKYIGSLTLFITSMSRALELKNGDLPGQNIGTGDESVTNFLRFIVSMLQDITAIMSVLGICIVGIMYIMSHGDEEKTETAKKYMIAILIGIILAMTAWGIISLIDTIPNSLQF
jgi:Type IV secretion system pilin